MLDAIIAGVIATWIVCGIILFGSVIYILVSWQDKRKYLAIKREIAAALEVYRMVLKNVDGDLPLAEYNHALRCTIRKFHLGENGRIEYAGSDKWYLAELITETVNQKRISDSTLEIALADAKLSDDNHIKQEGLTA